MQNAFEIKLYYFGFYFKVIFLFDEIKSRIFNSQKTEIISCYVYGSSVAEYVCMYVSPKNIQYLMTTSKSKFHSTTINFLE